ncbi:MAG: LPS biosynthesis glycosyltransferase [Cyanobacteria bacterium J06639_16]
MSLLSLRAEIIELLSYWKTAVATTLNAVVQATRLVDCIGQTFILAYKEETQLLEEWLIQAGCKCEVLRQVHQPEYRDYSRSYLCLLNHKAAWERALTSDQPTLIVEADFIPVKNFDRLPPPFDPEDDQLGIAWLYTCAPQVYNISDRGYAEGYSTSMVAYVITAESAKLLIELADGVAADPGPQAYTPWDSGIDYYLRDRGFMDYVPFRNYGEHGGVPNPEHQQNKLSKAHRADVLYGKLAFPPMYAAATGTAEPSVWFKSRAYARIKGLGRLLLGKYLRVPVWMGSSQKIDLLKFVVMRQLTLRL